MVVGGLETQHEVEQLLYREARLLDSWDLRAWFDLFTPDVRYVVPIRETLQKSIQGLHDDSEVVVHHVDEDHAGLDLRIRRIETGRAHAEEPKTRTRRIVSNVEILNEQGQELTVCSNFLLFQGRHDLSEILFSGQRRDVLRRDRGQLKIASRRVLLDHTVLTRPLTQFL
jgi:dibenzofuran dioxygenase beta subunit